MLKTTLTLGFLLIFSHAHAVILKNHNWKLTDLAQTPYTDEQITNSLRKNWDLNADDEDLAHLYSYQIFKNFKVTTAKVFLFHKSHSSQSATLINERGNLLAFDHSNKNFVELEDWIFARSSRQCSQLVNPTAQAIFMIQMNQFNPGNNCYYMIVPAHVWQRLELYPTSIPKDFFEDDIVEACFNSIDRKLFKKDAKACRNWVQKLN